MNILSKISKKALKAFILLTMVFFASSYVHADGSSEDKSDKENSKSKQADSNKDNEAKEEAKGGGWSIAWVIGIGAVCLVAGGGIGYFAGARKEEEQ